MTYKTITPVISTIILILITIVASTAAYFWMMGIQETIQTDTESSVNENAASDLKSFTLINVACNATSNTINITLMNDGIGAISSGTAILILTDLTGAELYTNINSSFNGLSEGAATTMGYVSTYDLITATSYVARVTLSDGKTKTRSCNAI
ncbi:MAG: hypothetical protein PHN19_06000 [Patescibacteria group bacterium]|nr:hypothetical protein [Patescibacteria group bacterium]